MTHEEMSKLPPGCLVRDRNDGFFLVLSPLTGIDLDWTTYPEVEEVRFRRYDAITPATVFNAGWMNQPLINWTALPDWSSAERVA
jgi:hypothetical protein